MKSGFASHARSGLGEELGAWVSTSLVELFKTAIIRKGPRFSGKSEPKFVGPISVRAEPHRPDANSSKRPPKRLNFVAPMKYVGSPI